MLVDQQKPHLFHRDQLAEILRTPCLMDRSEIAVDLIDDAAAELNFQHKPLHIFFAAIFLPQRTQFLQAKRSEFGQGSSHDRARFLEQTDGLRPEGMTPKLAFFAATVEELNDELRPAVEAALTRHGIETSSILVNVGDSKLTTNDDIREFNRLDTPESKKRFILLVNKGREGRNCRSLFGVGLYREPKSKIFVLQASMRCLRSIGGGQHTGQVYLAEQNLGKVCINRAGLGCQIDRRLRRLWNETS